MNPAEAVQNARPMGEILVSLAQIIGTQVTIMFLIDRAARLIEQAFKRKEQDLALAATTAAVDVYGPKPIRLVQVIGASSAEAPTTPPQEASTGSSSPSAT